MHWLARTVLLPVAQGQGRRPTEESRNSSPLLPRHYNFPQRLQRPNPHSQHPHHRSLRPLVIPPKPLPNLAMICTINRVIVYKINMLGYISLILFSHAMVSTLRWRTFVQVNQEPFFLPVDVRSLSHADLTRNTGGHCHCAYRYSCADQEVQSAEAVLADYQVTFLLVLATMRPSIDPTSRITERAEPRCCFPMSRKDWAAMIWP